MIEFLIDLNFESENDLVNLCPNLEQIFKKLYKNEYLFFKKYHIVCQHHSVKAVARSPTKFWGDGGMVGWLN